MKNILLFAFALVLSCGLTACGSDDDNSGNTEELLLGNWERYKGFAYDDREWESYGIGDLQIITTFQPYNVGYEWGREWGGDGQTYDWMDQFEFMLSGKQIIISYVDAIEGKHSEIWVIKKLTKMELVVDQYEDGRLDEELHMRRTY